MKLFVACEFSGVVRDSFRALGYDAWSCDLKAAGGNHIKGDVLEYLDAGWDAMIAHPPCTYLCVSGIHWTHRGLRDPKLTDEALAFFLALWNAPIPRIAIENPVGIVSTRICKPDQIIQPYQFGDDASKATCLWLKGLPQLRPTLHIPGRMVLDDDGQVRQRWANQTDGGQNRLPPSPERESIRSTTYAGIAQAMASQWGQIMEQKAPEYFFQTELTYEND